MTTLTGKIHSGTATQQRTERFAMRTFVLEMTDNGYTNYAELQLVNNNCGLLDQFKPGDMVTVHYNVRGNLWNSPTGEKCITNLNCWKIEPAQATQPAQSTQDWGSQPTQPAQSTQDWGSQPTQPAQSTQDWGSQPTQPARPQDDKMPF